MPGRGSMGAIMGVLNGVLGSNHSFGSLRRRVHLALASVPGIHMSQEILNVDLLPNTTKDRTYSVVIGGSAERSRTWSNTTEAELTIVVTYAKLLGPLGTQESHLTVALDDTDQMYQALMSDDELRTVEIAWINQSEPTYHEGGEGMAVLITQTYSVITRRDHQYP